MSDSQDHGSNHGSNRTADHEPNGQAKSRRHFGEDQKATIVRQHLADKVPVSDLADEDHIQPSLIYLWIKQLLDQAERAFQLPRGGKRRQASDPRFAELEIRNTRLETQVVQLTSKLAQKNEVIAELLEENVRSKKAIGELGSNAGFPMIRATKSSTTWHAGRSAANCRPGGS